jgi:hypothetical protein
MKRIAVFCASATLGVGILSGCGDSTSHPTCRPHSPHCRELNNAWIPLWYLLALRSAQHTDNPTLDGTQPSDSEIRASGGTPEEADHFSAPPTEETPHVSPDPVVPEVHPVVVEP